MENKRMVYTDQYGKLYSEKEIGRLPLTLFNARHFQVFGRWINGNK